MQTQNLQHWEQELHFIIDMHHLLSEDKGPYAHLTELFRHADLVYFSLGFIKKGVDKTFIKAEKNNYQKQVFTLA